MRATWFMARSLMMVAGVAFTSACGASSSNEDDGGVGGANGTSAEGTTGTVSSAWGIAYTPPTGWKAAEQDPFTFYASDKESGIIILGRGLMTTTNEALQALASFSAQAKLASGMEIEAPTERTIGDNRFLIATYGARGSDGAELRLRYVTVFSAEHGTSLGVLGITTTPQFDKLGPKVDALAQSVKMSAPTPSPIVGQLIGKWTYIKTVDGLNAGSGSSTTATITFDASGAFQYNYESSVDVFVPVGGTGSISSHAGSASSDSNQGMYTVIGSSLIFVTRAGKTMAPFTLKPNALTVGGRTYLQ